MISVKSEMKKFVHSRWRENEVDSVSTSLNEGHHLPSASNGQSEDVHEPPNGPGQSRNSETSDSRNLFDDMLGEKRRLVRKKCYPRKRYRGKDMRLQALGQCGSELDDISREQNEEKPKDDIDIFQRPQSTYSVLISESFISEKKCIMSIQDIVRLLKNKYPYFYTIKCLVGCVNQALINCRKFEKVAPSVWRYNDTTPIKLQDSKASTRQKRQCSKNIRSMRTSGRLRSRKRPDFLKIEWKKVSRMKGSPSSNENLARESVTRQTQNRYKQNLTSPSCSNSDVTVKTECVEEGCTDYFTKKKTVSEKEEKCLSENESKERILEYNKKVLSEAINKIILENANCLKKLGLGMLHESQESESSDNSTTDVSPTIVTSPKTKLSKLKFAEKADHQSKEKIMKYNNKILTETINEVIMENEKCLKDLGLLHDNRDDKTTFASDIGMNECGEISEVNLEPTVPNTSIEKGRKLLEDALEGVISENVDSCQTEVSTPSDHSLVEDTAHSAYSVNNIIPQIKPTLLNLPVNTSPDLVTTSATNSERDIKLSTKNRIDKKTCLAYPLPQIHKHQHVRRGKRVYPRYTSSSDHQKYKDFVTPRSNRSSMKSGSVQNWLQDCEEIACASKNIVEAHSNLRISRANKCQTPSKSTSDFPSMFQDPVKKQASQVTYGKKCNIDKPTRELSIDGCDDLKISDSPFDSSDEAMVENAFVEFAQKNTELDDIVALIDPMLVSSRSSQETTSSSMDNTFKNLFDFINDETMDGGNWHDDVKRASPDLTCFETTTKSPERGRNSPNQRTVKQSVSDEEINNMMKQNIWAQTSPSDSTLFIASPETPKINSVFSVSNVTEQSNIFIQTPSSPQQPVKTYSLDLRSPSEEIAKINKLQMFKKKEHQTKNDRRNITKKGTKAKSSKLNSQEQKQQAQYFTINQPYQQCTEAHRSMNMSQAPRTSFRYMPPYQWKVHIGSTAKERSEIKKPAMYVAPRCVVLPNSHHHHLAAARSSVATMCNSDARQFYTIRNPMKVPAPKLPSTRFVVPNNGNDIRYRIYGTNVFRFPTAE